MIPLFKNNYYRKIGTGKTFSIEFDKMPSSTLNHTEESKKAAIELYDLKQGELHLCYSGGVDSEFMVSVFIELGIPFTPVLLRYNPNYNHHDLEYSLKFCKLKNLNPKIVDIDFNHFVKSGRLLDLCKMIKTSDWRRAGVCEGISKLDGTVILGDCEPYVNLNQETMTWNFAVDEHEFAWGNFYIQHGIHGTPYFGGYTPEKYMSFLYNQRIQDVINNKLPGKLGTATSKVIVYNSNNNFNLEPRSKYHGYEHVYTSELYDTDLFKDIDKELAQYNGHYAMEIQSFIKTATHV
jgi:hypothetical protein